MENLKIKVNNEAESCEAQALLLKEGYKLERLNKYEYPQYVAFNPAEMTFKNYVMDAYVSLLWKEITLSALRNMLDPQHKENLKIEVVGDEAKSKEAQELFFKLGYDWVYTTMVNVTVGIIYSDRDGYLTVNPVSGIRDYKETTLQELRDKVVLKRNDVNDATHVRYDGKKYFHAKSTDYFYHFSNDKEWLLSNWMNDQLLPQLKPIQESKMATPQHKEYLDPHNNYELIEWDGGFMIQDHWIEVPMRAEILSSFNNGQSLIFHKQDLNYVVGADKDWNKLGVSYEYFRSYFPLAVILWQRHTQPNQTTIDAMNADADNEVHGSADELFSSILGTTAWDTQVGGNHYKQFKIQPMQFALENNLDAAQHNVIKYVMRHSSKNGKEDLEKAKHYIDLMIQHYYGAQ